MLSSERWECDQEKLCRHHRPAGIIYNSTKELLKRGPWAVYLSLVSRDDPIPMILSSWSMSSQSFFPDGKVTFKSKMKQLIQVEDFC